MPALPSNIYSSSGSGGTSTPSWATGGGNVTTWGRGTAAASTPARKSYTAGVFNKNAAPAVKTSPRPAPKPVGSNSWAPPVTIGNAPKAPVVPSTHLATPTKLPPPPATAVQPVPVEHPGPIASPLSQEDWQAKDPQYLQAIADLQKSLGDTTATTTAGISDYQNQLQNQIADAETQRQQQLASMLNDYASRGMDTSTGYQQAQDQYNTQQNSQEDAMRQAIQQRIAGLNSGLTDAQNSLTSGTAAAQQAAAARYQAALAAGLA